MKQLRFPKEPMCEACGDAPATSFSYFKSHPHKWRFTCQCTSNSETYYVMLDRIFSSPASTVDWLAHLNEKPWVDWPAFMKMMDRFRSATGSFNQL